MIVYDIFSSVYVCYMQRIGKTPLQSILDAEQQHSEIYLKEYMEQKMGVWDKKKSVWGKEKSIWGKKRVYGVKKFENYKFEI